jgi:hypothetical protein
MELIGKSRRQSSSLTNCYNLPAGGRSNGIVCPIAVSINPQRGNRNTDLHQPYQVLCPSAPAAITSGSAGARLTKAFLSKRSRDNDDSSIALRPLRPPPSPSVPLRPAPREQAAATILVSQKTPFLRLHAVVSPFLRQKRQASPILVRKKRFFFAFTAHSPANVNPTTAVPPTTHAPASPSPHNRALHTAASPDVPSRHFPELPDKASLN